MEMTTLSLPLQDKIWMKVEIIKTSYLEPETEIGRRREKEWMHKTHENRKKSADLRNVPAGPSGMGGTCKEQNRQQWCMMKCFISYFNSKLANAQTKIQ